MTAESAASKAATTGEVRDAQGPHPVPLLNIANLLTVTRLILVPVFLVTLFVYGGHDMLWRGIATGVFVVASLTDRVDGELARRRGLVTDFGKVADPIADKALTGAALVGLSVLGDLSWWITLVVLAREAIVTALRFWVIRHGVIPASRGGKLKTLLQAIAIGIYLLPLGEAGSLIRWATMGSALVATVLTGIDYVVRAIRLRATAQRRHDQRGSAPGQGST